MKKMIMLNNIKSLKVFFKEYISERLLNPSIIYPDMETKFPIEIIDLRHQIDVKTPEKYNYFKKITLILIKLDCFKY